MKRAFPQAIIGLFFLASTVCSIGCGGGSSDSDEAAIRIGALLDLSGPGRDLGNLSKGAIEQAIAEAAGRGMSISLRVIDTGSDPARAAEGLQLLVDAGITTVIGPQTSSEARQILPIANASGALIVSTGSTASALSIAKDSLYRLVPTDVVESNAVYELMRARGDTSFVTVSRQDTGNQGSSAPYERMRPQADMLRSLAFRIRLLRPIIFRGYPPRWRTQSPLVLAREGSGVSSPVSMRLRTS